MRRKGTKKEAASKRLRVLITAGPTREYLDPVRYLSNDSSGRMGFALASAAHTLGCEVTLVTGPVSLLTPEGSRRIDVISARQMHREVMRLAPRANIIVMAAAVSDFRPERQLRHKIKRAAGRSRVRTLALKDNPDILAQLGKKKRKDQILVGFAVETKDLEKNARRKLKQKGCDWIVANLAKSIGALSSRALLIHRNGQKIALPHLLKENLAFLILSHILV